MITLIHGDDITKSRHYFIAMRHKYPDAELFNGQDVTLTDLAQIIEGGVLFGDDKTIAIDLLSRRKSSADYKTLASYLVDHQEEARIFLWEDKILEKRTVTFFKNAEIKEFRLPQSLFIFLDSLKPGNGIHLLKLFHQTLENTDEDAVFYMLIRHFRLLLALNPDTDTNFSVVPRKVQRSSALKPNSNNTKPGDNQKLQVSITELGRLHAWQKDKLSRQSSHFSPGQLIAYYQELFKIESDYKTGKLPTELSNSIDIFLSGI